MLSPLRRKTDRPSQRRFRHGVALLPSFFTLGNLFCGYSCVVYSMRGEFETAAPFIGIAFLLDTLDGRIARMTGTTSPFGLELDSLADVISFGMAPAVMAFSWGLTPLGRWGWAAGFLFVTAAAMRLARFNIQSTSATYDKRYFVGMPSPAAAAIPAATVYAYPLGLHDPREALPAIAMLLVPAFLMVSTIRFRSFKTIDLQARRPYTSIILIAAGLAAIVAHPRAMLVILAYGYLASAFIGLAIARIQKRPPDAGAAAESEPPIITPLPEDRS
jgi:CDP-diacylglycerol---serine O-phosphatidyltransferase